MKRCLMLTILMLMTGFVWASSATIVHVSVGKVSEVKFPENIIKVVKGGASDSIMVEAIDNALYILPKNDTPSDVFVTVASGRSYPLDLKIAQTHDLNVTIEGGRSMSQGFSGVINVMGLMKDVLLGNEPAGATLIKIDRRLSLKDVPIELIFKKSYDYPTLSVYIIEARNLSRDLQIVPVEQISFKNITAIASSADTLDPIGQDGDRTNIYMIVTK